MSAAEVGLTEVIAGTSPPGMRRVIPTTLLALLGTFSSCLCLVAIPLFLKRNLGYSATVAGVVFGLQYATAVLMRPASSKFGDRAGPRSATQRAYLLHLASTALLFTAFTIQKQPVVALVCVALCRVGHSWAESYLSVSAAAWGIARAGTHHAMRIIGWSGIAVYSAIIVGAPVGQWLYRNCSLAGVAVVMLALSGSGLALTTLLKGAPIAAARPLASRHILRRILPFMLVLGFSGVGFGSFNSLVALYFEANGWGNASLAIVMYGACSVFMRTTCGNGAVWKRRPTLAALLMLAAVGLLLLRNAPNTHAAIFAAGVIGVGSSLTFPLLGEKVVSLVNAESRSTSLGYLTSSYQIFIGATGSIAGLASVHLGFRTVYGVAATFEVFAATLYIALPLESRRHTHKKNVGVASTPTASVTPRV